MRTRLVTPPSIELVTLDEAKAQLRVDGTDEDFHIAGLITSMSVECEQIARRAFLTQTWDLTLDGWPSESEIVLPYPPLQSVTSISYIDSDGVTHTMPTSDYFVDSSGDPGRVCLQYGKSWPCVTLRPRSAIQIRFVAGWSDPYLVPANYRQALLLRLSNHFENRGDANGASNDTSDRLLMVDRGSW